MSTRVLVACEFSGTVRDAFRKRGFDAWSCDLLPSEKGMDYHIQGDVLKILNDGWNLLIAHPPCTHIAVSGARWFKAKGKELQEESLRFFLQFLNAPVNHVAVENPVSVVSSRIRPPDQIIHPWWFGDEFEKTSCLWLRNLPKLRPSQVVGSGDFVVTQSGACIPKWYSDLRSLPTEQRRKERSRTFIGIAEAMADQWGRAVLRGYKAGFGLKLKHRLLPEGF